MEDPDSPAMDRTDHEVAEVEMISIPPLGPRESVLLDLHSFLNLLTILQGEISRLRARIAVPGAWKATQSLTDRICYELRTGQFDAASLEALGRVRAGFDAESQAAFEGIDIPFDDPQVGAMLANLRSLLETLDVRLAEYLRRRGAPHLWSPLAVDSITAGVSAFLEAVARNSHGRYGIVDNIARQQRGDYLVAMKVESDEGSTLTMPDVLQDVLRDLIANARKYTAPGGVIHAGLYRSNRFVSMVVEDNGIGIPRRELSRVAEFGYRATNARALHTNGGGFGLTKALAVTQEHEGRMWLRSRLGGGTRVTIQIPVPDRSKVVSLAVPRSSGRATASEAGEEQAEEARCLPSVGCY